MASTIIGIDLGTTNSLCAAFEEGEPRLIPNAHGEVITPSVVGVLEDGQVIVGAAARELRVSNPERCVSCFKRQMGADRQHQLGALRFTPVELSSIVLRSLAADASAYLGRSVRDAVVTVPAYFNDNQRKATKLAGEMAGLNVLRIVNEPTAAALTYGFHDRQTEQKLIVIDLGGGTFDVTVMEVFEGTLEIVATAGDTHLGGEDFTDRIAAWVLEAQELQLETAELKWPLRIARLREQCERAKRTLGKEPHSEIRVPDEAGRLSENSPIVELSADRFAEISSPLVDRLLQPIGRAIRDARSDPQDFSNVILVGGATRMELLNQLVRRYFGCEPHCRFNPDEVVAQGAAVQAALLEEDRAVDDMVMTDVCPFTLGIAVMKQFGAQHRGGYYMPIIHRNTTLPVSREEIVSTIDANQTVVRLNIYQGEARRVEDNLLLGKLDVIGIPPGPAGQEVHVRFTYDLNGILEVEAYLPQTGKKFRTVVTQHAQGLTQSEIRAAVAKIQSLKFYPRDELANQHLLRYAERVVGEISPFQRDELESAIDAFESGMSSYDRELFEFTRQGLLTVLSAVGMTYESNDESGQ